MRLLPIYKDANKDHDRAADKIKEEDEILIHALLFLTLSKRTKIPLQKEL